jgi:hypothetical protein
LENENWQNGTCVEFKHASEHLADWQVWRMTVAKMIFMRGLKMAPEHLAD